MKGPFFLECSRAKTLAILLIVLAGLLSTSVPKIVSAQPGPAPVIGVFSSTYGSANITDTSLHVGSQFFVQVNVTNAPTPFNGYEFVLYYDQRYITVSSYDYTTNTIFPSPYVPYVPYNGPGALRMSVVDLGQVNTATGMLVNITFTVVQAGGVSPLALAAGMAKEGSGAGAPGGVCPGCPTGAPNWSRLLVGNTLVGVDTSDGYFKNVAGTSGPVAAFTFSPPNPAQGQTVTFNATTSFDPDNPNAFSHGIAKYFWDFGDQSGNGNATTIFPTMTHLFTHGGAGGASFAGNFSIRLTVEDSDSGFQGMQIQLLSITLPASHCVEVSSIFAKSQIAPGQSENLQVQVHNNGTFTEKFNITVRYGPPNATLGSATGLTIAPGKIQSYPFNISTTNLALAVYNIEATASLYGYPNCAGATFDQQFQVVASNSNNAILLVVGVVVLLVAVMVIVSVFLRRRRKPEPP